MLFHEPLPLEEGFRCVLKKENYQQDWVKCNIVCYFPVVPYTGYFTISTSICEHLDSARLHTPYQVWFLSPTDCLKIICSFVSVVVICGLGLPWWLSGKESACHCRRHRRRGQSLDRKIPWRRKWQPTPVFLPGKSHGQRSQAGYRPCSHKRVRQNG